MNATLLWHITRLEVKEIAFLLGSIKAPGLDGLLEKFYQHL